MTVQDVREILQAEVLYGEDMLDKPVESGCGADLMSDVLAFVKARTVLITGLINLHVVRTSEMVDISCIVFSRGKMPSEEILEEAAEAGIAVLATQMTTYQCCGELYKRGLPGTRRR
ncbi:MAG: hypothetical protein E7333_02455 [Clostridiales bacterium]|nr:hypothetical protein [Clostridiales bacterium]